MEGMEGSGVVPCIAPARRPLRNRRETSALRVDARARAGNQARDSRRRETRAGGRGQGRALRANQGPAARSRRSGRPERSGTKREEGARCRRQPDTASTRRTRRHRHVPFPACGLPHAHIPFRLVSGMPAGLAGWALPPLVVPAKERVKTLECHPTVRKGGGSRRPDEHRLPPLSRGQAVGTMQYEASRRRCVNPVALAGEGGEGPAPCPKPPWHMLSQHRNHDIA